MHSWNNVIASRLDKITYTRNYRAKTAGNPRQFIISDKTYINWVSFDYLNLSHHYALRDALSTAVIKYGIGSTGAPTLCGYSQEHDALARELSAWLGYEKCLLFTSGYQLALGIFTQLADSNTTIWLDKNIHASHIDGILLSRAKFVSFSFGNVDQVIGQIKLQGSRRHILLTEGAFSMDGTCTYLPKLIALKETSPENVLLIVDDAHGIGALGKNGLGTLEQLNLNHTHIDLLIGTLGKAFASHGGFIVGSELLIDYLQQTVRSLLFSTCLPAGIAAASRAALSIISSEEGVVLRKKLIQNINYFKELCYFYNLPLYQPESNISAIQLLLFHNETLVKNVFEQLLKLDILCGCIIYPTVNKDLPRIRISINAGHLPQDIQWLCYCLNQVLINYA